MDTSAIPATTNEAWGFYGTIGHFADDVANELFIGKRLPDAIDAVSEHWLGWMISSRTARETGIPWGLPYLTGFVLHAEIEADTAA